jgi:hypothetical protein
MSEFDKTEPYSLVYGHPGAAFEQNGALYDVAGNVVVDEVKEIQEPEAELVVPTKEEYSETRETDWNALDKPAKQPETKEEPEKKADTLPAFTVPAVDEEKARRSAAASERMKASWALRKGKEADVE